MTRQLTAIIEKEGDGYVALCPQVDVASQGDTVGQARENLKEALELFFEMASPEEIDSRLHDEAYTDDASVTHLEIAVGQINLFISRSASQMSQILRNANLNQC